MAAMPTWSIADWLNVLAGHRSCLNNHVAVTHYKRHHDAQIE